MRQRQTQRRWYASVEENAHLCGCQCASSGVFQNVLDLRDGYTGKPFDELSYQRAIFQVLEQCGDRDARAMEDPNAAYALGISLYGGA